MDIQKGLSKLISKVWADYCADFKKEPLSIVNFCITNDLEQEYRKIRPDHAEKFPERIESVNNFSALTIMPSKSNEKFYVLLDSKYFVESLEKDNSWAGTVAHELTHVYDHMEYADLVDCHDYDIITNLNQHWMFNIWTEFHAKAVGYYYERKYSFEDVYDTSQVEYIVQKELPSQLQEMIDMYSTADIPYNQMYAVAHFLGRLFVWEKLFSEYFTENMIQELLGSNKWMLDTYIFLKNHFKLDEAYRDFEELKNILRQNFRGDF